MLVPQDMMDAMNKERQEEVLRRAAIKLEAERAANERAEAEIEVARIEFQNELDAVKRDNADAMDRLLQEGARSQAEAVETAKQTLNMGTWGYLEHKAQAEGLSRAA